MDDTLVISANRTLNDAENVLTAVPFVGGSATEAQIFIALAQAKATAALAYAIHKLVEASLGRDRMPPEVRVR